MLDFLFDFEHVIYDLIKMWGLFSLQMLKQQKDACKTIVADKNRLIEEFQNVGRTLNSSQINLQDKCWRIYSINFESYFPFSLQLITA